jgi:signal transduction histidine kinase
LFAQDQQHDRMDRLLLVGRDGAACARLRDLICAGAGARFQIEEALTFEDGLTRLLCGAYDVGLIAQALVPRDGLALIREAGGRGCVTPLILLSQQAELDDDALAAGADDCLDSEQLTPEGLARSIRWTLVRALRHLVVATAIHDLRGPLSAIYIRAQVLAQRLARCAAVEQAQTLAGEARAIDALAHKMARQISGMADVWRECLGRSLEIHRGALDLVALARSEIDGAMAPSHPIRLLAEGEIIGYWDGERLGSSGRGGWSRSTAAI